MYGRGTRRKARAFWKKLRKGHVGGRNKATEPVRRPRKKDCGIVSVNKC
jgi:hypothetical protein